MRKVPGVCEKLLEIPGGAEEQAPEEKICGTKGLYINGIPAEGERRPIWSGYDVSSPDFSIQILTQCNPCP
jgi:hypothetical protein